MFRKNIVILIIAFGSAVTQSAGIKKWTDDNGKVHYGDIAGHSHQIEIIDVNNSVPEITEGEALMRLKNDLYFQEQDLKQKARRLSNQKMQFNKRKKLANVEKKRQKRLNSDRRACIKAKLKIEDIEDSLREGYTTKKGIQLEKKRRQQKRQVDAYCH